MEKVRIYYCFSRQIEENEKRIRNMLTDEENAKADRLPKRDGALLSLGSSYLKHRFVSGNIYASPFGKPYADDIFFSISHSCDIIGIAFSSVGEIGLDIEKDRDEKDGYKKLSDYCLSGGEKSSGEAFLTLFTAKESLAKAEGMGLSRGIKSIPALPLDGTVNYEGKSYYRKRLIIPHYRISVCVCSGEFEIKAQQITDF